MLRRLRTTLKLYRLDVDWRLSPAERRALKRLAARSGECRDREIEHGWLGARAEEMTRGAPTALAGLIERVAAEERATRTQLRRALGRSFPAVRRALLRAVRPSTGRVAPEPREMANTAIVLHRLIAEAIARIELALGGVRSVHDVAGGHGARIAVKQLRYLLEPIAGELDGGTVATGCLAELQGILGDLHDRQMIGSFLDRAPGIALSVLRRRANVEAKLFYARFQGEGHLAWRTASASLVRGLARGGAASRGMEPTGSPPHLLALTRGPATGRTS